MALALWKVFVVDRNAGYLQTTEGTENGIHSTACTASTGALERLQSWLAG